MRYIFPIIITFTRQVSEPQYLVHLPDFDAMTQGLSLADAIEMGEDLACILALRYEEEGQPVPEASLLEDLARKNPESIVALVVADTDEYRKLSKTS